MLIKVPGESRTCNWTKTILQSAESEKKDTNSKLNFPKIPAIKTTQIWKEEIGKNKEFRDFERIFAAKNKRGDPIFSKEEGESDLECFGTPEMQQE